MTGTIDAKILRAASALHRDLAPLRFGAPVVHVYDPLEYARAPYRAYVRRYAASPKRVLFLGMNPGPFGMMQTGVPFGDVTQVREWLAIEAPVKRPKHEHPRRPVLGFDCARGRADREATERAGTRRHGSRGRR